MFSNPALKTACSALAASRSGTPNAIKLLDQLTTEAPSPVSVTRITSLVGSCAAMPVTSASAGGYQALVGGKPTTFTVAADGSITAGTGECKLSGKIDFATSLGGAQTVMLNVSSCGSIGNSAYTGVVFASDSTAPAAWQLIAENGTNVIDLLAYR